MNGFSGFNLNIRKEKNKIIFVKSTKKYPERLKKQCEKQIKYGDEIKKELGILFNVPKVYKIKDKKNSFEFGMEYISGRTIMDIIEYESYEQLEYILERIFHLIKWELSNSIVGAFKKKKAFNKMNEVCSKTQYDIEDIYNKIKKKINKKEHMIPVGACHGDLTMSNMIFSNKITLIDFHDPYLESPMQDISKMIQEIEIMWSYRMSTKTHDYNKIIIGYDALKKSFYQRLKELNMSQETIDLFSAINFFRLFAYTKDKQMYKRIRKKCEEIL